MEGDTCQAAGYDAAAQRRLTASGQRLASGSNAAIAAYESTETGNTMRTILILAVAMTLVAGCGGGGDQKGECVFGPRACGSSSVSPSTPGSGSTSDFTQSGTGDSVFSIPSNVSLLRIQAQFAGSSSNFIVRIAGQTVVNEIIGTSRNPPSFDGTYVVTPGAQVEIRDSTGVSWTATAARVDPAVGGLFARSGTGDTVFDLPTRASRYRIQATFAGASQNFIVRANESAIVNSIIGTSRTPMNFDGTYALPGASRIEIRNSSGVSWSFTETP